jgi:hypothetical protein
MADPIYRRRGDKLHGSAFRLPLPGGSITLKPGEMAAIAPYAGALHQMGASPDEIAQAIQTRIVEMRQAYRVFSR